MRESLDLLISYNHWALEQFFNAIDQIDENTFLKDLGDGVGSVRDKLVHMYGAEKTWLERLRLEVPAPFTKPDEFTSKQQLKDAWTKLHEALEAYYRALADADFGKNVTYKNLAGKEFTTPIGLILLHVFNHGTYHRGQAASLLRRLTGKPPVTDFIAFVRDTGR